VPNDWVCLGHPASPLIMLSRKSCFRLITLLNGRSCDYVSSNSMLIFHCPSYLSVLSNRVQKLQYSGSNPHINQISYRIYWKDRPKLQYKQQRHSMYKRNTETRSRNHCCRVKEVNITYSECVSVTLVIQNAMRIRRIILSCLLSGCVLFFAHYPIYGTIVG